MAENQLMQRLRAALEPEEGYQYGEVLPLRTSASKPGTTMQLALPNMLRDVGKGVLDLLEGTKTGQVTPDASMALVNLATGAPKPKGAAGIFGGRLGAKPAQRIALEKAEGLEQSGASREAIYETTGWFRGVDGKWRFEIPDNEALVNQSRVVGGTADEVLLHPWLYDHYPQLEKTAVRFNSPRGNASYNAKENRISASDSDIIHGDPKRAREILLHELQHGVQIIEGFAPGSNVDRMYNTVLPKANGPEDALELARDMYYRSAGEVEARLVGDRAGYSDKLRKVVKPWDDADVHPRDQIIHGPDGEQLRVQPVEHNPFAQLAPADQPSPFSYLSSREIERLGLQDPRIAPIAAAGRGNDKVLAHISLNEARRLDKQTDGGSINPHTGLLEFEDGGGTGGGEGVGGGGESNSGSDSTGAPDAGGPDGFGPDTGPDTGPPATDTYGPPETFGPPEAFGPPQGYGPPAPVSMSTWGMREADERANAFSSLSQQARDLGLYGGISKTHDPSLAAGVMAQLNALEPGFVDPHGLPARIMNMMVNMALPSPLGMMNKISSLVGGPSIGKSMMGDIGETAPAVGTMTGPGEGEGGTMRVANSNPSKQQLLMQLLAQLQAQGKI